MITLEQLEIALGDDKKCYRLNKDVDRDILVLNLLRDKIPYEVCKGIIGGAGHDKLYLCAVDKALPYLDETDLITLADCNVCYDKNYDGLFIFV